MESVTAPVNKAARRPGPERNPELLDTNLEELRRMRKGLKSEENHVSYWRRILQARVDLMRKQVGSRGVSVPQLAEVLSEAASSHRRVAAYSLEPFEALAPLPNIAEIWTRPIPEDAKARQELLDDLSDAEQALSQYRHELHRRIDLATGELIARYREKPGLALTALRESLPNVTTH
jgi:hypothetical protein